MRTAPLQRQLIAPVGLVRADGSVVGEWGTAPNVHEAPRRAKLYAHREASLQDLIEEGKGSAFYWRSRVTSYDLDGRRVAATHRLLEESTEEEAFNALRIWAEWLRECGANVGSLSGSAWSLWRTSLHRTVSMREPDELPWDGVVIGGRQSMRRAGHYMNVDVWDIQAAYPSVMVQSLFPRRLKRFESVPLDAVGIARAEVTIPHTLYWGPLPLPNDRRTPMHRNLYPRGPVEGVWSLEELRLAHDLGAKVVVREAWAGNGLSHIFTPDWAAKISEGRELPGLAGTLAKRTANSLWGSFVADGQQIRVSYERGKLTARHEGHDLIPRSRALGALITAGVRTRLYREALSPLPVIACHTDSAILPHGTMPQPAGELLGGWRAKDHASELLILDPQVYRYNRDDGSSNYVVAGAAPGAEQGMFKRFLRALTSGFGPS